MLLCAGIDGACAQSYLERLENSAVGGATVTVTQSKEIDALVNGKKEETSSSTSSSSSSSSSTSSSSSSSETSSSAPASSVTGDTGDTSADDTKRSKVVRDGKKVTGYRVQVFSGGNTREDKFKAQNAGSEIKAYFPEYPVYVHFYSPHWKCLMGNFSSYDKAQAVLEQVKAMGYSRASIVKGKVTVSN